MLRKLLAVSFTFVLAATIFGAADTAQARANLPAADIVSKSVVARGGLQGLRAVQSISTEGKLGAGGSQRAALPVPLPVKKGGKLPVAPRPAEEVQLPFVMAMQRLRSVRLELQFNGKLDGANGWKFRPHLNRRDVEPFTAMQSDLDGPLVDYAVKGNRIDFVSMERVEDQVAYKLKLTMKDSHSIHVWIDSKTFFEAKIEGQPRLLDGIVHPVEIYNCDFCTVNGLQIPFVLETQVLPVNEVAQRIKTPPVPPEKIFTEKVVVNPKLEPSYFSKPTVDVAMVKH